MAEAIFNPAARLDALGSFASLKRQNDLLVDTLVVIEETCRWYAANDQRDPREVDHALCVELLSLAESALDRVSVRA